MKSKGQNQKITQVITISQNYKQHRHNLSTMKPAIDGYNKKRDQQVMKIATERLKYRQAARDYGKSLLDRQNLRIVDKLTKIAQEDRSKRYSHLAITRGLDNQQQLKASRSSKRLNSASSSKSFTSVCSNARRRTLRQQQIDMQNKRIARRLENPKTIRTLAVSELKKSYQREQQIVKTRSRFSQKNQQIMRSLALYGLKFQKKDVQYLPQIASKKKIPSLSKSYSQQKFE